MLDVLHDRQHLQKDRSLALFWRYWKNRALDQFTARGEDRPMQTGVAHFRNALCRQEPSHLVEK
jgi:hypothetical protein